MDVSTLVQYTPFFIFATVVVFCLFMVVFKHSSREHKKELSPAKKISMPQALTRVTPPIHDYSKFENGTAIKVEPQETMFISCGDFIYMFKDGELTKNQKINSFEHFQEQFKVEPC